MEAFNKIYKDKGWGLENNETLSGGGSTQAVNEYRNAFLSSFINAHDIKMVYDICGDCNWQRDFVSLVTVENFTYFGFDVSEIALNRAKEKNRGNSLTFSDKPLDLCTHVLKCPNPSKSLIIIKEVIQHLPLALGIKMLKNIKASGIQYIAITNHDREIFNFTSNVNIQNIGGFYHNNMFIEPFNFKNPIEDISEKINNKNLEKTFGNMMIFNIQEQNI